MILIMIIYAEFAVDVALSFIVLASYSISLIMRSVVYTSRFGIVGCAMVVGTGQHPSSSLPASDHIQAREQARSAYDACVAHTSASTPTIIATELGGTTLAPGVYTSASGTFTMSAGSTLTLMGAVGRQYIFRTTTTFVTGAGCVVAVSGTSPSDVFFAVGTSASFGASNKLVGNYICEASVSVGATTTLIGKIATAATVTLGVNVCIQAPSATAVDIVVASASALPVMVDPLPIAVVVPSHPVPHPMTAIPLPSSSTSLSTSSSASSSASSSSASHDHALKSAAAPNL